MFRSGLSLLGTEAAFDRVSAIKLRGVVMA
jgi:hypothetical protein